MDQVVEAAIRERRRGLDQVLRDSVRVARNVQRTCFAKHQKSRLVAELTTEWLGSSSLTLKRLRTKQNHDFVAPEDEPLLLARLRTTYVLLLHRSESSLARFQEYRKDLRRIRMRVAQSEGLHLFLETEKRFASRYLSDSEKMNANRTKMKDFIGHQKGFIKSQFMDDKGTYMDAQFLLDSLNDTIKKCKIGLALFHADLLEHLKNEQEISAICLQSLYRLRIQRRKVRLLQEKWVERMKVVTASKQKYLERSTMLHEDETAFRIRKLTKAVIPLQRNFREFITFVRERNMRMTQAQYKRFLEERAKEETIKAKLRREEESFKSLQVWQCPHCAKLGMQPRRKPFPSWEDVEKHLADHRILQDRKESLKQQRMDRINATWEKNLAKERTFIRELRTTKIQKEQNRFKIGLLKAETIRGDDLDLVVPLRELRNGFVLHDGDNEIGRSKRHCKFTLDSMLFPKLVSKHHCTISVMRCFPDFTITIMDLNSTNGTSVNDQLLPKGVQTTIQVGDKIMLGTCPDHPQKCGQSDLVYIVVKIDCLPQN